MRRASISRVHVVALIALTGAADALAAPAPSAPSLSGAAGRPALRHLEISRFVPTSLLRDLEVEVGVGAITILPPASPAPPGSWQIGIGKGLVISGSILLLGGSLGFLPIGVNDLLTSSDHQTRGTSLVTIGSVGAAIGLGLLGGGISLWWRGHVIQRKAVTP